MAFWFISLTPALKWFVPPSCWQACLSPPEPVVLKSIVVITKSRFPIPWKAGWICLPSRWDVCVFCVSPHPFSFWPRMTFALTFKYTVCESAAGEWLEEVPSDLRTVHTPDLISCLLLQEADTFLCLSAVPVCSTSFDRSFFPPPQMMPEIRTALFGANNNRKFLD